MAPSASFRLSPRVALDDSRRRYSSSEGHARLSPVVTYQLQSQACEARKATEQAENQFKRRECLDVAEACSAILPMAESTKFVGAKVLWVDDHPENNVYERQALTELGGTVVTATDTRLAIAQLASSEKHVDAIISDFSRTDDPKAAYTLLKLVGQLPDPPPMVIYSASSTPRFAAEAILKGAFGETDQPKELMTLVVRSVASRRHHEHQALVPK
jgi:CheY-like chemotaxis protein